MRSVALITKIVPLFLWSAKMPKIYAKCQKSMQKLWNFIFCHLNIVRAVYKLSFKLLVRSVAHITKIVPPFLWFRGGLCYKHRRIRHGDMKVSNMPVISVTTKLQHRVVWQGISKLFMKALGMLVVCVSNSLHNRAHCPDIWKQFILSKTDSMSFNFHDSLGPNLARNCVATVRSPYIITPDCLGPDLERNQVGTVRSPLTEW